MCESEPPPPPGVDSGCLLHISYISLRLNELKLKCKNVYLKPVFLLRLYGMQFAQHFVNLAKVF